MPFSMMMSDVCHVMLQGEIFNADRQEYPLFDAVLYGDRVSTSKFSKRLGCAVKHLPLRIKFTYEHDTYKAVEQGISVDPTLIVDGEIFLEGLVQAEVITKAFEKVLSQKKK